MFQDDARNDALRQFECGALAALLPATGYVPKCDSRSVRGDDSTPGIDVIRMTMTTTIANTVRDIDIDAFFESMRAFELKRYHESHKQTTIIACVIQTGVAIALGEQDVSQITIACVAHFDRPDDDASAAPVAPIVVTQPSWLQRAAAVLWRKRNYEVARPPCVVDDSKSLIADISNMRDMSRGETTIEDLIRALTRIHTHDAEIPVHAHASIHDGRHINLAGYAKLNLFDVYRFLVQHRSFIDRCILNPRVRFGGDILVLNLSHAGVRVLNGEIGMVEESSCCYSSTPRRERVPVADEDDEEEFGATEEDESLPIPKRARTNEWGG